MKRSPTVKLLASVGFLALVGLLIRSLVIDLHLQSELRTAAVEAPSAFRLLRFGLLPVTTVLAGVALYRIVRGTPARGWLLAVVFCVALPVALKAVGGYFGWRILPYWLLAALYVCVALIDGADRRWPAPPEPYQLD